jgi:hypothetical protein
MLFQLHEWDIHIVCRGADDASGAGGEATDDPPRQAGNFHLVSLMPHQARFALGKDPFQ